MFKYPWGATEDNLTGDFFGLMKHLPPEVLLLPFVDRILEMNHPRSTKTKQARNGEVELWPEYPIPKEWRNEFNRPDLPAEKRRSKFYIVPDVVLHFDDSVFVIEAEKSMSVEAEQLFQQYLVCRRLFSKQQAQRRLFIVLINTDQIPPYRCGRALKDDKGGISILPQDSIPTYICKRADMLREAPDLQEVKHTFLWFSWHEVGKLSGELLDEWNTKKDESSNIVCRFLLSLKGMMDDQGFYPVRLFKADDPTEIWIENVPQIQGLTVHNMPSLVDLPISIDPDLIPVIRTGEEAVGPGSTLDHMRPRNHPKEGIVVTPEQIEKANFTVKTGLEIAKKVYDLADVACERMSQDIAEQLNLKKRQGEKWGTMEEGFAQRYGSLTYTERYIVRRYCFAFFDAKSRELPKDAIPFILFSIATRSFTPPPAFIYGVIRNIHWGGGQKQWLKADIEPFMYEISEKRRQGPLEVCSSKTLSKKGTADVEFVPRSLFEITSDTIGDIVKEVVDWLDERITPPTKAPGGMQ